MLEEGLHIIFPSAELYDRASDSDSKSENSSHGVPNIDY